MLLMMMDIILFLYAANLGHLLLLAITTVTIVHLATQE